MKNRQYPRACDVTKDTPEGSIISYNIGDREVLFKVTDNTAFGPHRDDHVLYAYRIKKDGTLSKQYLTIARFGGELEELTLNNDGFPPSTEG